MIWPAHSCAAGRSFASARGIGCSRPPCQQQTTLQADQSIARISSSRRRAHSKHLRTRLVIALPTRSRISHSGYNAPRHHLMRYREEPGQRLFREVVGPLTTPRRVLEAIVEGRADVGPQDSFAFDLMCRHLPELATQVRVLASTDTMSIPAFMASDQGLRRGSSRSCAPLCCRSGIARCWRPYAPICVSPALRRWHRRPMRRRRCGRRRRSAAGWRRSPEPASEPSNAAQPYRI